MEKDETVRYGKLLFSILNDYLNNTKSSLFIEEKDLPILINIAKDNSILIVTYLALKFEGVSFPSKVETKLSEYFSNDFMTSSCI